MNDIKQELISKFGRDLRVDESVTNFLNVSIRHWGVWELPSDCEDEEDYDFEELSNDSYTRLTDIINMIEIDFPKYSIEFSLGEKNYIYLEITIN